MNNPTYNDTNYLNDSTYNYPNYPSYRQNMKSDASINSMSSDISSFNLTSNELPDIVPSINNEISFDVLNYIRNRTNNYGNGVRNNNNINMTDTNTINTSQWDCEFNYNNDNIKQEYNNNDTSSRCDDVFSDIFSLNYNFSYDFDEHEDQHQHKHSHPHLHEDNHTVKPEYINNFGDFEDDSDDFFSITNSRSPINTPQISKCTSKENKMKFKIRKKNTLEYNNCDVTKKIRLYKDQLFPTKQLKIEDGKWKCPVCLKFYVSKKGLKTHYRVHTMDALCCDKCDYKCIRPSQLAIHKRVHSGERPFCCKLCSKRFKHKHTLKGHMDIHMRHYKKRSRKL